MDTRDAVASVEYGTYAKNTGPYRPSDWLPDC
jgi:hypothetical protein